MHEFSRVLLHVDARQANPFLPRRRIDVNPAVLGDGQIVLGGLKILRQIRIVIILSVKFAVLVDRAVRRKPRLDRELYDAAVDDRQDARQAETDGTDMRVLRGAEGCGAAAENLRVGLELAVNLKTDDSFEFHAFPPIGASFV